MKRAFAAAVLACAAFTAGGQTVYRCGPDGREYSTTPCPGGRAFDASDARTPAEREAARRVARDDERLADQLARERRAREAEARPAAGFDTVPKAAAAERPHKAEGKPAEGKPKAPKPPKKKTKKPAKPPASQAERA